LLNFFQLLFEGFVTFAINAVLGGVFFLVLRGVIRRRVEEWLHGAISGYIRAQLELSLQRPEETARALKPIIVAIMNEVLKDYQKGQGEGMVKIPFLGRVPSQLVQAFVERFLGGSKKSNNEGSNPFA